MTKPEMIADLCTVAGLAEDMAHEHLAVATDHEGRAAVVLAPSAARQLHLLVRELARRARELEAGE